LTEPVAGYCLHMAGYYGVKTMRRIMIALLLSSLFRERSTVYSDSITIAGYFSAFSFGRDSTPVVDNQQCQHFAAFMMAIDEVNNKTDGAFDSILKSIPVEMALSPGQSLDSSYPPNPYFDGASAVSEVKRYCPTVIGCVETNTNLAQARASASASNSFNIVSILSNSASSTFNDVAAFPMNLQIAATTFSEASQLVGLITSAKKWQKVVLFTDTGVASIDSYAAFSLINDVKRPVTIIGDYFFDSALADYTDNILAAKRGGGRIFVFFLNGQTAGRLLEQGYNAGLFHDGTQVLATSTANIDDIRSSFTAAGRANEAEIMKGFLSTAPHPEYHFSTPQGQSFVSRFRKLPPTLIVDPITKATTCNTRNIIGKDGSYNNTNLSSSIAFRETAAKFCLGFKSFETFDQNGSNIDATIMYTYDSVLTYLLTADVLMNRGIPLSAPALFETMQATFFTQLVTGNAFFISGRGTRVVGNVLKLVNYQPASAVNEYSTGSLAFVGEYTDSTGWLLCGSEGESSMLPYSQSLCNTPLYRNIPVTASARDAPTPITLGLPLKFRILLMVFASFGLCTLAVWGSFIFIYWKSKQIRVAQPKLMSFLLLGGAFGLIKVMLSAGETTQASCITQLWFSHYSFRLIFRTLLLKLWRIDKVVNASSFKRIIVSENQVLLYLLLDIVLVTILLLIPITAISYNSVGMVGYVSTSHNNQTTLYVECQVRHVIPFFSFYALNVHPVCYDL
jgi:7 transmembrane sweet-taste receptor of 3 GCPR/Receptor family ligand binding region